MEYLGAVLSYTPVAQQATVFQTDALEQITIESEHTRYFLGTRDPLTEELCVLQTIAQEKRKKGVVIYIPKEPTPLSPPPEALTMALQTLYQEQKLITTVLIRPEPEPYLPTPTSRYVSQLLDRLLCRIPAPSVSLDDLGALMDMYDLESLEGSLAQEALEGA